MGKGRIIVPAGCDVWPHEMETARALAADGRTVEFMPRTEGERVKSPDIAMGGILWEMKAPEATTVDSLERVLRRASRQSPNVIVDAARAKNCGDPAFERRLRKAASAVKGLRRLVLVRKSRIVSVVK